MYAHRGTVTAGKLLATATISAHPGLSRHPGRARGEVPLVLMVDTGANVTAVPEAALATLGIPSTGIADVRTSGPRVVPFHVYRTVVSIELTDHRGTSAVARLRLSVLGIPAPLAGVPYQGLLGLDLLRHFRLVYDGPLNTVELTCDTPPR